MDNKIAIMDNRPNNRIKILPAWSSEEMLIEFVAQVFNEKLTNPTTGIKRDGYKVFALNMEDGLEFGFINCRIPRDLTFVRTAYQILDPIVFYYFFSSGFDYFVENKLEKNVEGLVNGIIAHNYIGNTTIPLKRDQEFNFVIIRLKRRILGKYFKTLSGELYKLLFNHKPFHYYENINPDILMELNSLGQLQANLSISKYLIFSKTIGLLALTFDLLLKRDKELKGIVKMPEYEKVVNARNYLMSDLQKIPTVKRLSRFMGMSDTNAKILFKQVFKQPVYEYFKNKKMELAYQMIKDTDRFMVEIARKLGYRNPGHFSADFKKYYGISPKKLALKINRHSKG